MRPYPHTPLGGAAFPFMKAARPVSICSNEGTWVLSHELEHGPAFITERLTLMGYQELGVGPFVFGPHLHQIIEVIVELQLIKPKATSPKPRLRQVKIQIVRLPQLAEV